MGSPYHQYIIADDWIIPPESEIYYSEKVLRLPCYQPNDRKRVIAPERPRRSAAGLPENAFVFCCFNGTHKISRFTFERWLEILSGYPGQRALAAGHVRTDQEASARHGRAEGRVADRG